ncbi:MAG: hypothetical protein IPO21_04345 [Bacteroidales bacterium]|nr:hypothetical protein [Bacteroidales bacterium]
MQAENQQPLLGTGVWSGTGVSAGGELSLSTAGVYPVTYTYTTSGSSCSYAAELEITVSETPSINFLLIPLGCVSDSDFQLSATGTPAGGVGVYSAVAGVSATGLVSPSVFTPETDYTINYTYTTAVGCESSSTQNYRVYQTTTQVIVNPVSSVVPDPHPAMGSSRQLTCFSGTMLI